MSFGMLLLLRLYFCRFMDLCLVTRLPITFTSFLIGSRQVNEISRVSIQMFSSLIVVRLKHWSAEKNYNETFEIKSVVMSKAGEIIL